MFKWTLKSQTKQKLGYKVMSLKTYIMPSGNEYTYTIWGEAGSRTASVVALTADNNVIVSRQYRPGPEMVLDELPGGFIEDGETPRDAALREMQEETGYTTDSPLISLGESVHDAYSNQMNHYFLATDCYQTDGQHLDEEEFIEVALIPIDKLIADAKTGKMTDSVAVLMALDKLREIQTNNLHSADPALIAG